MRRHDPLGNPHGPRGARHGGEQRALGTGNEAAGGDLEDGRRLWVADEPVGERACATIGGAAARDPEPREARTSEILHGSQRPRGEDGEGGGHDPTATNRTDNPGVNSAGSERDGSHRVASVLPMSCHPPGLTRG